MIAARITMLSAALLLGACNGSSPTPAPTPTPSPTPTPTVTAYNVENCFTQTFPGTNGLSFRSIIVPDTLKLDLSRPSGWPNGRDLDDPVVDILIAALFLDFTVTGQGVHTDIIMASALAYINALNKLENRRRYERNLATKGP